MSSPVSDTGPAVAPDTYDGYSSKPTQMRRVAVSSLLGCVLEWYDFYLYGFAAALVFGHVFFPSLSPLAGTLASLGTFAVGFVARPVGGALCGHFGDRIGRKSMLILTITVMGIATMLFGVLPGYDQIGIAAPILLIILRFAQGLALGGEWGGAVLMVTEHARPAERGWWGSVVQLGAPLGQALATGLLLMCSVLMSNDAFLSWGWRIPFLASALLLIVGLYIRLKVTESPEFAAVKRDNAEEKMPLVAAFRQHPRGLVLCFALYTGAITVPFFINGVFMTSYATAELDLKRNYVLLAVVFTHAIIFTAATLLGGRLSDQYGRKPVYLFGTVALALFAFPTFAIVDNAQLVWLVLGMCLFGIPMWICWGVTPAYFSEQFGAKVRYSAISISGQAATIIGGLVPLVSTAAVDAAGGAWPVAAIGCGAGVLATLALLVFGRETHTVRQTQALGTS